MAVRSLAGYQEGRRRGGDLTGYGLTTAGSASSRLRASAAPSPGISESQVQYRRAAARSPAFAAAPAAVMRASTAIAPGMVRADLAGATDLGLAQADAVGPRGEEPDLVTPPREAQRPAQALRRDARHRSFAPPRYLLELGLIDQDGRIGRGEVGPIERQPVEEVHVQAVEAPARRGEEVGEDVRRSGADPGSARRRP